MRTEEFIPGICKKGEDGADPKYEGKILVEVPGFTKRLELYEQAGFRHDGSGSLEPEGNALSTVRKTIEAARPFIKEVAIRRIEDGKELKSFEDLDDDPACAPALIEISTLVLHGFGPSKN